MFGITFGKKAKAAAKPTLVIGGTGKTGRRVAQQLRDPGLAVRIGSRTGDPAFDWNDQRTWAGALKGVGAAYITYQPDLAVPGAPEAIRDFAAVALEADVQRLVLLSGRGEEEAQRAEEALMASGAEWTILRASWFAQNFSENFFADGVRAGELMLPAGAVREPFIDVDDIADAAVAALTDDRHIGQLYELTGPRLLTFAEAVDEIASVTGRPIRYAQAPAEAFAAGMAEQGVPDDVTSLVMYLFTTVLDGRNESVADGVERALGRKARDFSAYARTAAATGVWGTAS